MSIRTRTRAGRPPVRARIASRIPVRARLAMIGSTDRIQARAAAARQRVRNARVRADWDRGRRGLPRRAGDQIRSRMPVVRDRVNLRTGRPHRMDVQFGRGADRAMARVRDARAQDPRPRGRVPR